MLFDLVLALLLALSFYWGYKKGLIYALLSFLGIFICILAVLKFSELASEIIIGQFPDIPETLLPILAFILILVCVGLSIRLIAWSLEKMLETIALGTINKIFGGLLYVFIGLFCISILVWFADQAELLFGFDAQNSFSFKCIKNTGPIAVNLVGKVWPIFQDFFQELKMLYESVGEEEYALAL